MVHDQAAHLDSHSWSRFRAVCIYAPGVDVIIMLEPEEIVVRMRISIVGNIFRGSHKDASARNRQR